MAFFVLLIYISLAYIRPFELFPGLGQLHLMQLVGGIGILLTVASLPFTRFSFREKPLYLTLLFLGIVMISRTLALRWIGGALVSFEEVGITVAVFLMIIINVTSLGRVRLMLAAVSMLSLYLVAQSVAAVHFGAFGELLLLKERVNELSYMYVTRVRSTGFMTDPNDLAQSLVCAMPFVGVLWRKQDPVRNLFLVLLPISLLTYGVYLTHSRGAIISMAVLLLLAARSFLGRMGAGLITGMGVLMGLLLNFTGGRVMASTADASIKSRLEFWSTGLQLLKSHPFVGVGYGQFTDYNGGMTAHNSAVLCFAELGFPAFCVWVALILVTVMELNHLRKMKPESADDVRLQCYARAIQLSLYAFLTAAWFLSRTYTLTLYLLIGLAGAVADIARRSGRPLPTPSLPKLSGLTVITAIGVIGLVYASIKLSIR